MTLGTVGRYSSFEGVALDGKQCVVGARALSEALNDGRTIPLLGTNGGVLPSSLNI